MRSVLLITANDSGGHQRPPDKEAELMEEYAAFTEALHVADALRGGERLRPSCTATTVRVRDGKAVVTDGPFAETKEHLGGFSIVESADLDEAIGRVFREESGAILATLKLVARSTSFLNHALKGDSRYAAFLTKASLGIRRVVIER